MPQPEKYVDQVGGDHYGTKYGHWDYCKDAGTGYLEGHATKYLYRWRKKGGIQDLEKALSFVDKIMVGSEDAEYFFRHDDTHILQRFFNENDVPIEERAMIGMIFNWRNYADLEFVRSVLVQFIALQQNDASANYTNQG